MGPMSNRANSFNEVTFDLHCNNFYYGNKTFNPPMTRGVDAQAGEGGRLMAPPIGFSNSSRELKELYFKKKCLAVASSLKHLPMKKN